MSEISPQNSSPEFRETLHSRIIDDRTLGAVIEVSSALLTDVVERVYIEDAPSPEEENLQPRTQRTFAIGVTHSDGSLRRYAHDGSGVIERIVHTETHGD